MLQTWDLSFCAVGCDGMVSPMGVVVLHAMQKRNQSAGAPHTQGLQKCLQW